MCRCICKGHQVSVKVEYITVLRNNSILTVFLTLQCGNRFTSNNDYSQVLNHVHLTSFILFQFYCSHIECNIDVALIAFRSLILDSNEK